MALIEFTESGGGNWQTIAEGVEKKVLRAQPGENRVLLRLAPGKSFPDHHHSVPDEVYVVEGTYTDPGVEGGKAFGPGSYLYYPAGTDHQATTPTGCVILVWNSNTPK